jgi:hypothetical protein
MQWTIGKSLAFVLTFVSEISAAEQRLTITVLVYNYAAVNAKVVAQAQTEATRIYIRFGIEPVWLICPLTVDQAARNRACELPRTPTVLVIRLLPRGMTERLPLRADVLGFALLPSGEEFAVTANVCADRAREIGRDGKAPAYVLLGHIIAHELGHLLLHDASHSADGMMRMPWRTAELERMKQGTLFFLPAQAKEIHTQVLARCRNETSSLAATVLEGP